MREQGMYTGLYLAKYIINKCTNDGYPVSNLQLQKILFNLQKYFIVNRHKRLIIDDFEAWPYGPVLRNVYIEYCSYGSMAINQYYSNIRIISSVQSIIDPIINRLRIKSPWDLVEDTHCKGGAWDTVYKNGAGNKEVIPLNLIEKKGS